MTAAVAMAADALPPPEIEASEAALLRPSALSAALSQMLADPLWYLCTKKFLYYMGPGPLWSHRKYG